MNRIILSFFIEVALLVAIPHFPRADDVGLYDPTAPAGSAFIRVINASPGEQVFRINGRERASVATAGITPYYYTRAGQGSIAAGNVRKELQSRPGEFYTAIFQGKDFALIKDQAFDNKAKSRVYFYNLGSGAQAALYAAGGKIEAVAPTEKFASQSRDMNPVSVDFAAYADGKELAVTETQALERGAAYSAILLEGSDRLLWVKNTIDTKK